VSWAWDQSPSIHQFFHNVPITFSLLLSPLGLFQSLTRRTGRREIQFILLAVGLDHRSFDRVNQNIIRGVFWFLSLSCPRRVKGGGLNLRRHSCINISLFLRNFFNLLFLRFEFHQLWLGIFNNNFFIFLSGTGSLF
jgi:hypothetical protein